LQTLFQEVEMKADQAVIFGIFLLVEASPVLGDQPKPPVKETTKPEVQVGLKKGWDKVVFGKELDHEEYLKLFGALAASLAVENPAPLTGYLKEFVQESLKTLASDLKTELVLAALSGPDKIFREGKLEVSGGFATYRHQKAVGTEVPYKIERDGVKITVRKRMEWAVVDLPNTYQPYVRIRVKK
jgi:hypothetical protein